MWLNCRSLNVDGSELAAVVPLATLQARPISERNSHMDARDFGVEQLAEPRRGDPIAGRRVAGRRRRLIEQAESRVVAEAVLGSHR
jgi:hypothetical protein